MKYKLAFCDFVEAVKRYHVWFLLGWLDVKQRYRRSSLGPWWISISMAIFIAAMGAVFSRVFHTSLKEYVPFFTAGFLVWVFISTCINESVEIFRLASGFVKQVRLPFNVYILKHMTRNIVYLLHNLVVLVLVMIIFKIPVHFSTLLVIPAFFILFLNMYWISLLISLISIRYRDMVPVVSSCVQIAFFVTPITWLPRLLNPNSYVLKLNPFAYFVESIRAPLLGVAMPLEIWVANIVIVIVGFALTFLFFAKYRSRIPFWVD